MRTMPEITFIETETRPTPSHSVIWLHGLGADGQDFAPIVPELALTQLDHGVRFIFPNAPYQPVTCNGGYVMRSWYDILSLEPNHREIDLAGLQATIRLIRDMIAREPERGIPSQHIFLAGFSQGGAVAYATALTHPEPLGGIIALSTYLPAADFVRQQQSTANTAIPTFIAHGLNDSVVSMTLAEQAVAYIRALGITPDWHTFDMEHEVCPREIADLGTWLR